MDLSEVHTLTAEVAEAIERQFEYKDWPPEKVENGRMVRAILAQSVKVIIANVPPCHDRTVAIERIQEARMYANSGITHAGKD